MEYTRFVLFFYLPCENAIFWGRLLANKDTGLDF
jgi:hypothetical protein